MPGSQLLVCAVMVAIDVIGMPVICAWCCLRTVSVY